MQAYFPASAFVALSSVLVTLQETLVLSAGRMCGIAESGKSEVERKLSERVGQRVLSWYGHMIRMDEDPMTKVWRTEVSGAGVRVRRRPRKGWMEGVERALGMRGLSVEQGK